MSDKDHKEHKEHMNSGNAKRVSILSLIRLSIGNTEIEAPNHEEIDIIERTMDLKNKILKTMNDERPTMLVAMAALTQSLEDVLCEYQKDMPSITTAVSCKLLHHAAQHMELEKSPSINTALREFTGLIH
jgi:predicted transcriptional regulator